MKTITVLAVTAAVFGFVNDAHAGARVQVATSGVGVVIDTGGPWVFSVATGRWVQVTQPVPKRVFVAPREVWVPGSWVGHGPHRHWVPGHYRRVR